MQYTHSAISLAISSAFCISSVAWADNTPSGANGVSWVNGVPSNLIKENSEGILGENAPSSPLANGGNGANIQGQTVSYEGAAGSPLIITGSPGESALSSTMNKGSTGWGGVGGGAISAGVSTGGTGGLADRSPSSNASAQGGKGGNVTQNVVTVRQVNITGAVGGDGGNWGELGFNGSEGSAGGGGEGGGSVFGGLSRGGTGGTAYTDVAGGSGGEVSSNSVTIAQAKIQGAAGGAGGNTEAISLTGAAGRGGNGGASVFGGLSMGGAAGVYAGGGQSNSGGDGGKVSDNQVKLTDVELIGGVGGAGGSARSGRFPGTVGQPTGASGAGGYGGGSVFGGLSIGASGGLPAPNSTGGLGGEVSGNSVELQRVVLKGAQGGRAGGEIGGAWSSAGNAPSGHGGGSVFGGLSEQGTSLFRTSVVGKTNGAVYRNTVAIQDSELHGAAAGETIDGSWDNSQARVEGDGSGGLGGGSVFGGVGISGYSYETVVRSAPIYENTVLLSNTKLYGGKGANGGSGIATSGAGGLGGGVVVGGMSSDYSGSTTDWLTGKRAGDVDRNRITMSGIYLQGETGGNGGTVHADTYAYHASLAAAGAGGHGGGSVFGGISEGGASTVTTFSYRGGIGGNLTGNRVTISDSELVGANAGTGGSLQEDASMGATGVYGGAGRGGHGGGSVFGAISTGAAANAANASANGSEHSMVDGGDGGTISASTLILQNVTLRGANGGRGGNVPEYGAAGAGGHGGGSVFGGVSSGGAAGFGYSYSTGTQVDVTGGDGGAVSGSEIHLYTVTLIAGDAGEAGVNASQSGGSGMPGLKGGSVFGGVSTGGTGGYAAFDTRLPLASGGNGGDVSGNRITVTGISQIANDIYGGYSQGGAAGILAPLKADIEAASVGIGGKTNNNTITLVDDQITIGGSLYGGLSINGDGKWNPDADFTSVYQGNTLNLNGFKGSVEGIYHFENYNWVLPKDVVNQSEVITITGTELVQLENTKHTIAMENDGNVLHAGDKIILINKAQGNPLKTPTQVQQGLFIVYDVTTEVTDDQFVLEVADEGFTSPPDETPDGRLDPRSKAFVQGRLPMLAGINHGADLMSDYGIDAARAELGTCGTNMFALGNGSASHYDTSSNSHFKVRDFDVAIGGAKCFMLPDNSTAMLGAFVEHGDGNYNGFDGFSDYRDVRSWGKIRYTGVGALFHMNVANTGTGPAAAMPGIRGKDGLYVSAAVRAGNSRLTFDSGLTDAEGVRGRYTSKAPYASVSAGVGYAWQLNAQRMLDVYGRYTYSYLGSDSVTMGKDVMHFDALKSSRVRVGARYNYADLPDMMPYIGLAYEHEFNGKSTGTVYGMDIDATSLKGGSGMMEVGVAFKPVKENNAWTVNIGLQGFFGEREGMSGGVKARYSF